MAKSGDVSFVSRFLVKFVEIIAAGLATAVSGYLIANLSGAFSSSGPTPSTAVIQVTPSTSMLSSTPQPIAPSSTNSNAQASTLQQTPAPQQVSTPQQDVNGGRAPQQGPTVLDTAKLEARKHIEKAASAPESSRYKASLLDRIRAALANVDANRKDRLDVAPHQPRHSRRILARCLPLSRFCARTRLRLPITRRVRRCRSVSEKFAVGLCALIVGAIYL